MDREVDRQRDEIRRLDRVTRLLIDRDREPTRTPTWRPTISLRRGFHESHTRRLHRPLRPLIPPRSITQHPPLRSVELAKRGSEMDGGPGILERVKMFLDEYARERLRREARKSAFAAALYNTMYRRRRRW